MTDRQLDRLIMGADPAAGGDVDAAAAAARAEVMRRIAAEPLAAEPRRGRVAVRAGIAVAGVAAAAAVGYAGLALVGDGGSPAGTAAPPPASPPANAVPDGTPTTPPESPPVPEAPTFLITQDGWVMSRADQAPRYGEVEFTKGDARMQLNWYPRADRDIQVPDPERTGTSRVPSDALPGSGLVIAKYGSSDRYRAAWHHGGWTMELDGEAASSARFEEVLLSLREVGEEKWLAALPASTVTPLERGDVVSEMIAGVPLPPGLAPDELRARDVSRDRYQLGAEVAGAVACGWIEEWLKWRRAGVPDRAEAAVRAMATSRSWPVLNEMDARGDYPEFVWQLADAMASGGDVPAGKPGVKVQDVYRDGLGCAAG